MHFEESDNDPGQFDDTVGVDILNSEFVESGHSVGGNKSGGGEMDLGGLKSILQTIDLFRRKKVVDANIRV